MSVRLWFEDVSSAGEFLRPISMPTTRSSKTPTEMEENPITEQENPTPKLNNEGNATPELKDPGNVINEIHSEKKSHSEKKRKKIEQGNHTPKLKKLSNVSDEIFAEKKLLKDEQEKFEKSKEGPDTKVKVKKMKKKKSTSKEAKDSGIVDLPSRPKKRAGEGLVVYTKEDLGFGMTDVGGTPLYTFDCVLDLLAEVAVRVAITDNIPTFPETPVHVSAVASEGIPIPGSEAAHIPDAFLTLLGAVPAAPPVSALGSGETSAAAPAPFLDSVPSHPPTPKGVPLHGQICLPLVSLDVSTGLPIGGQVVLPGAEGDHISVSQEIADWSEDDSHLALSVMWQGIFVYPEAIPYLDRVVAHYGCVFGGHIPPFPVFRSAVCTSIARGLRILERHTLSSLTDAHKSVLSYVIESCTALGVPIDWFRHRVDSIGALSSLDACVTEEARLRDAVTQCLHQLEELRSQLRVKEADSEEFRRRLADDPCISPNDRLDAGLFN